MRMKSVAFREGGETLSKQVKDESERVIASRNYSQCICVSIFYKMWHEILDDSCFEIAIRFKYFKKQSIFQFNQRRKRQVR